VKATPGSRSPEYALLGFLFKKPDHGYELYQTLSTEFGQIWHSSLSQTYNILKRLETRGYITSTLQEQNKLPARQVLALTESGRQRFKAWLRTPTGSSVRAVRVEFLTRLYFIQRLYPNRISSVIEDQTTEIRSSLRRLEETLANVPASQTFNRLGVELRIRQLNSILDWLVECRFTLNLHHPEKGVKK
jgi:DNA-binding PadR family transcriptional regulator